MPSRRSARRPASTRRSRALRRRVQRLLAQHVFAGRERRLSNLQMRVGRREDHHGINSWIGDGRIHVSGRRKPILFAGDPPALFGPGDRVQNAGSAGQVQNRLRMGGKRAAKTHDREANHGWRSAI